MRNATYIGRSQCKCKCHPARSVPALVLARDSPQWSSAKREPSRCALLLDGARLLPKRASLPAFTGHFQRTTGDLRRRVRCKHEGTPQ